MSSSAKLEELRKKKNELKDGLQSLEQKERTLRESVEITEEELGIQELTEKIKAKRVVVEQLESVKRDLEKVKPKIQQERTDWHFVREYLNLKAAENRHTEITAYLMFIAGVILFVGGLMVTFYSSENLNWFLFLPYSFTSNPASLLGFTLTLSGMVLSFYGVAAGLLYSLKRAPPIQQLYQAYSLAEKSENSRKGRTHKKTSNKTRKGSRKSAK